MPGREPLAVRAEHRMHHRAFVSAEDDRIRRRVLGRQVPQASGFVGRSPVTSQRPSGLIAVQFTFLWRPRSTIGFVAGSSAVMSHRRAVLSRTPGRQPVAVRTDRGTGYTLWCVRRARRPWRPGLWPSGPTGVPSCPCCRSPASGRPHRVAPQTTGAVCPRNSMGAPPGPSP